MSARSKRRLPSSVLLLGLLFGCTGPKADTAADVCADAHDVDWYSFGDGYFRTYCRSCHSAEVPHRYGAPETVNFDSEADVRVQAAAIRRVVLVDGTMPVGGGVLDFDGAAGECAGLVLNVGVSEIGVGGAAGA